jgi:periplasmic divalent cation tolerance protein
MSSRTVNGIIFSLHCFLGIWYAVPGSSENCVGSFLRLKPHLQVSVTPQERLQLQIFVNRGIVTPVCVTFALFSLQVNFKTTLFRTKRKSLKEMTDYIQVVTTTDSKDAARKIADYLIEKRVAACVQISESVQSRYRWQGKMESATEFVLSIKSRQDLFGEIADLITSLHSYDVPEILSFRIEQGSSDYLAWLDKELRQKNDS